MSAPTGAPRLEPDARGGLRRNLAPLLLVGLMLAYAALSVYLTRGVTFIFDETKIFATNTGFDLSTFLEAHNGHLLAPLRALYAASIALFGGAHLPIQMAQVLAVIAAVGCLFELLRPRIGDWAAVTACGLLLFLGSSPDVVLSAVGFPAASSTAFGLAALLVLERRPRGAAVLCSCLLLLSVISYSSGLAFLAAAAVWLLLDEDRVKRVWVWAIPLAAYAAWLLWAPQAAEGGTGFSLGRLDQAPSFSLDALSAVLGSLAGLPELVSGGVAAAPGWGYTLASVLVIGLVAVALSARLGRPMLAFLAIPVTYWTLIALGESFLRTPYSSRFIFVGAVGVILVGAEAASHTKVPRSLVVALALMAGAGLIANLLQLHEAGTTYRVASERTRAAFAVYELAGPSADPAFVYSVAVPVPVGQYLESVPRNGSLAMSPGELVAEPEAIRRFADQVAALALHLEAVPVPQPDEAHCRRYDPATAAAGVPLPPGGAAVLADPGTLRIGRFADTAIVMPEQADEPSPTAAGGYVRLDVSPDAYAAPWKVASTPPSPLEICALPQGQAK